MMPLAWMLALFLAVPASQGGPPMNRSVIVLPVSDVLGFNNGTPYPGSPTTHFDKVDDYPASDQDGTGLQYDLTHLPGVEYFGIDPAVVSTLPANASILSVEAVLSIYSPQDAVDILSTAAVVTPSLAPIGQSGGAFIPLGWNTMIVNIPKADGTNWNRSDFMDSKITYLIAGGGSVGLKVSQFFLRVNIEDHPGCSGSSSAALASESGSASSAAGSSAPSGASGSGGGTSAGSAATLSAAMSASAPAASVSQAQTGSASATGTSVSMAAPGLTATVSSSGPTATLSSSTPSGGGS